MTLWDLSLLWCAGPLAVCLRDKLRLIGGMKGKKHKGPVRKIVGHINGDAKTDMFNPPLVQLECGHSTHSWGQLKARCRQCALT